MKKRIFCKRTVFLAILPIILLSFSESARVFAASISTSDGLSFDVSDIGATTGASIGGTVLPMLSSHGGFSFREILSDDAARQNLLLNPGFEGGEANPLNWSLDTFYENTPIWDNTVSRGGAKSIKITISGNADGTSGQPTSSLIKAEPFTEYTLSAWVKTDGILGTNPPAVRVIETGSDKKTIRQQTLDFSKGTNDWQLKTLKFKTAYNTAYIYVFANLYKSYGTFWLDDVNISADMPVQLNGTASKNPDGSITQNVRANEEELDFTFTYIPKDRFIEVHGDIQNLGNGDRALQIMYALPINATGWHWADYARRSRNIEPGTQYENTYTAMDMQRTQNAYPFSYIGGNSENSGASVQGLSIAVPMEPRIYRTGYNLANGYTIQYDFGLSDSTLKIGPGRANFTFIIYKPDEPEWGFRSAAKKYYELYPQYFTKRNENEGLWIAAINPSEIENVGDFGIGFDERGEIDTGFDERNGIYSFVYTEPWGWWRDFGTNPIMPSYSELVSALEADANSANGVWMNAPLSEVAQAVINSGPYNSTGAYHLYNWHNWGSQGHWYMSYPTNPDPDLPMPNRRHISYEHEIMGAFDAAKNSGSINNWTFGSNSSWDGETARAGSRSARIDMLTDRGDMISGEWISGSIAASPSAKYNFSAWMKSRGASAGNKPAIRVVERDANKAWITQHSLSLSSADSDWILKSMEFTANESAAFLEIHANIYSGNGTAWFDDASLTLADSGAPADNLIKNGGFEENADAAGSSYSGIYLDSIVSAWSWGTIENFRKEHWQYADQPLVFSYNAKKPAQLELFSNYEYARNISEAMHNDNKLILANIFYGGYGFFAPLLDIMGSEIYPYRNYPYISEDEEGAYRRTLSYKKTGANLMQWLSASPVTNEDMKKYIKRETFYAIFPGISGAGGAYYWKDSSFYNRDRPLFKKYIPIIKEISKAGWEPIPYATIDNSNIWLERYGNLSAESLHFSVRTEAPGAQTGTLNAEITKLGAEKNRLYNITATELVNQNALYPAVSIGKDGTTAAIPISIASNDTLAYKLEAKAIDAYAVPESGAVSVAVSKWNTTLAPGRVLLEFIADAANGDGVDFSVLSLKPNANYSVKMDGKLIAAVRADASGKIVFDNSVW